MVLLPVQGLTSYHADARHPNHKPELQPLSIHWTIFVDGREIEECTGFDIPNGFATYFARDAMGRFIMAGKGRHQKIKSARAKGVVTVFMVGKDQ